MSDPKKLKQKIYQHLTDLIDQKIETAKSAIDSAREARDSDTKSSVGDKYETGRAMMQIELEKSKVQLGKALDLKKELSRINIKKEYLRVAPGCLVLTNQGSYFICIGIGEIKVNNQSYYSISLVSPIGQALKNKNIGDTAEFNDRVFTIVDIV